ncbi:MAG: DUF4276 family protein [Chloroflexota bacterium]
MEIGCIIEGDGEEDALPILLRRVIQEIDPTLYVHIRRPFRRPKGQLKKQLFLSQAVTLLARQLTPPRALLILLDADDDCPAEIGPQLLGWAQAARRDIPMAVVMATREYEAWFLAAAESLRGHRGLPGDLMPPTDSETVSGAKEWLRRHMSPNDLYSPVVHQASFSQVMSLEQARRSPSFDKLCRDVRRLVEALRGPKT